MATWLVKLLRMLGYARPCMANSGSLPESEAFWPANQSRDHNGRVCAFSGSRVAEDQISHGSILHQSPITIAVHRRGAGDREDSASDRGGRSILLKDIHDGEVGRDIGQRVVPQPLKSEQNTASQDSQWQ